MAIGSSHDFVGCPIGLERERACCQVFGFESLHPFLIPVSKILELN